MNKLIATLFASTLGFFGMVGSANAVERVVTGNNFSTTEKMQSYAVGGTSLPTPLAACQTYNTGTFSNMTEYPVPPSATLETGGDINNDGRGDLVFRDRATGKLLWISSEVNGNPSTTNTCLNFTGNNPLIVGNQPASIDTTWKAIGVGRFNINGGAKSVYWYQSSTKQLWAWNLATGQSSATLNNSQLIFTVPSNSNVFPQAVGDFNGDGNGDIVWRDYTSGDIQVWYGNGAAGFSSFVTLNVGVADFNWIVIGGAKHLNNGKQQLMWYYAPTGQVAWWDLTGATVNSTGVYSNNVAPYRTVVSPQRN